MQWTDTQPTIEIVEDAGGEAHDWLDDVLAVGASMDWVTPALALARGGATLAVWRHEHRDAQQTLRHAGIPAWGWTVAGDYILVNVPRDDARRACVLLGLAPPEKLPSALWGRVWLVFALLAVLGTTAALFLLAGGAL